MALGPLVTLEDFEGWLGLTLAESEQDRASRLLVAVSSLVRSHAGLTWEDTDVPEHVRTVVFAVAARVWRNPDVADGASSVSLTTGPFGKTLSFADPKAAGLFLSAEQKAIVSRGRTTMRGLWTQATTRGDDYADTVYVPVVGTENLFPFLTTDDL